MPRTGFRTSAALVLASSTLVLAGCGARTIESIALTRQAPYDALLEMESPVQAGTQSMLRFTATHEGDDIDLAERGRELRVILASNDGSDIRYVQGSTRSEEGTYDIEHHFARAGAYTIWAEIEDPSKDPRHNENADALLSYEIDVIGSSSGTSVNAASGNTLVSNGIELRLQPGTLRSGAASTFSMELRDGSGTVLRVGSGTQAGPYVILDNGHKFFRHGDTKAEDGKATWTVTFPRAGAYLFWVEFTVTENGWRRTIPALFSLLVS